MKLKKLDPKLGKAIDAASAEVASGALDDHFPLVVWQTGSGTQTNMNVNEVLANRANEMLGGKRGDKKPIHPNDQVNYGQSSNDSFPTAMHIAAVVQIRGRGRPGTRASAEGAGGEVERVRQDHQDRPHPSAGCDAGDLGPGVLRLCRADQERHRAGEKLPAASPRHSPGRGPRSAPDSMPPRASTMAFASELAALTGVKFVAAENKFEGMAAHDAFAEISGAYNVLAASLMKIANDIRLLGSGPALGPGRDQPAGERARAPRSCRARSTRPRPRR